jgi:UDP-2,4-diacetamido-2,4,6-trideoxy-beta-L-altropyranose hydrolase
MAETLLVRADAGVAIGSGHVMRCLALAQAWQDAGGRAVFVLAETLPALQSRLCAEGVTIRHLNVPPGGVADAATTGAWSRELAAKWVVVDGELFEAEYVERLRADGTAVLLIDDFGTAEKYSADIILNQNLGASPDLYYRKTGARLLLGTEYILLRREFRRQTATPKSAKRGNHLLITFGGTDPDNLTLKAIRALRCLGDELEITVAVGGGNPRLAELRQAMAGLNGRLLVDVADMAELMSACDLAVICAGGTLWELLHMGCAVLSYSRNPVQAALIADLAKAGAVANLGAIAHFTEAGLRAAIAPIAGSATARERMRVAGQRIVDGDGVPRVLRLLNGKSHGA